MALVRQGTKLLAVGNSLAHGVSCCCPVCQGACCIDGECTTTSYLDCVGSGGTFYGCGVACDDYANLCSSPPTCDALGCNMDDSRISSIVATINIDTFLFTPADVACVDNYYDSWVAKVEELNGTYVLTKRLDPIFNSFVTDYAYSSGTPGEYGHLDVSATFSASFLPSVGGYPCVRGLQIAISKRNFSESDGYAAIRFESGQDRSCYIPAGLAAEATAICRASTQNEAVGFPNGGGGYEIDSCDGLYIQPVQTGTDGYGVLEHRIGGALADGAFCDVRDCINFWYYGTVSVELVR